MAYLLVFVVLLVFVLIYDTNTNGTKKNNDANAAVLFALIMLSLLAGLRYRVGTDTLAYMDEYEKYPLSYYKDKYLLGWYALIAFCKSLHLSFYCVQIILAFFTNYAVVCFLKRYALHFFSSLLLYYIIVFPTLNFEILRQGVSVAIFLLSFHYLEERKLAKYFICGGIACLFHSSALVLLFIPLLIWIPVNKKTLTGYLALITLVIVFSSLMKEQIYEFSRGLSFLDDRAFYYFSEVDVEESFSPISYIYNLLLNVIIPLLVIRFHWYSNKLPSQFIIICMFSMILYIVSIYMPIIYRFNSFFQLFNLVLFVYLFNWIRCRFKFKPFFVFFICLMLFVGIKSRVYFAYDEGRPVYYHYYPYSSIFNEFKVPQREQWE